MRRLLLALAAAVLALPAAAQTPPPVAPDEQSNVVWGLQTVQGRLDLDYAAPDTDNIEITLDCKPGSGRVSIWAPLERDQTMRLRAGGLDHTYPSTFRTNEETGGERTAATRVDDPLMKAFAISGAMILPFGDEAKARTAAEKAAIAGFFRACAAPAPGHHAG